MLSHILATWLFRVIKILKLHQQNVFAWQYWDISIVIVYIYIDIWSAGQVWIESTKIIFMALQCCTWTSKSAASRKDVSSICKIVCTEVQDSHQKQSKTASLHISLSASLHPRCTSQIPCIPASSAHLASLLLPTQVPCDQIVTLSRHS